jgi:hypothetical protein
VQNPPSLSPTHAREVLRRAGITGAIRVEAVHEYNHVWRLRSDAETFYLKAFTKPWHTPDETPDGGAVTHEAGALRCLQVNGLAAPELLLAEDVPRGPLGWPFLLTRAVPGQSLVSLLRQGEDLVPLMLRVGDYMRRMHAIAFPYPGYITTEHGPSSPPPEEWRHRCWTAEARRERALATFKTHSAQLAADTRRRLESQIATIPGRLRAECFPPHFVHGDCHAHHFFLMPSGGAWSVTGTFDMEVASAGDIGEDFLKLGIELASLLPASTRWWEDLFQGYGGEPNFDLLKLRLLASEPEEFAWLDHWPKRWDDILRHIFDADSWHQLFDIGS